MTLEICVSTLDDARAALAGGADRLELCAALATGGVTPSAGLIEQTISLVSGRIPVNVLIRPREGDFVYSEDEVQAMLCDIDACANLGASGVVIGALTPDARLDTHILTRLADQAHARGLSVTLSRAIDLTSDPVAAVGQAVAINCDRILTSGGEATALDGARTLSLMHRAAAGRTLIMAASGINESNLPRLLAAAQIDEVHGSFRGISPLGYETKALPGLEGPMRHTSAQCVAKAKTIIQSLA